MHCLANGVSVVCETMTALLTLESRIFSAMFFMVLTPTLPSSAKNTKICGRQQQQTQDSTACRLRRCFASNGVHGDMPGQWDRPAWSRG